MLRKFTLELEKENSVLLIFGFSLADKHIKDLLYGVMKSNPTLVVVYFSYSQYDEAIDKHAEKKNPNLYVISPEPDFSFKKARGYISKIFNGEDESEAQENDNEDEE